MSTLELKNKVMSLLSNTDDDGLLLQIIELISKKDDFYYDLSEEEKEMINKGIQDLENGNTIPYEDVLKELR